MGIHRKSFAVLDSDREAPEARIGKPYTEAFLKRADPSRVWITDGREIENAGSGLGVADARPSVELAERLRSLRHSPLDGDAHPLCGTRLVTRG